MSIESRAVLGIDAGTTSAKAVVVDDHGEIVSTGESDTIAADTSSPGRCEQDAEDIWQAVASVSRQAVARTTESLEVVAVATAAQSGSVIPVDHGGGAGPVVTWMDTRARPLVHSWTGATASQIRAISGWKASAGLGLATISWLREQSGFEGAGRWSSVDDYLTFRMSGQWATNPSNAAGMQLMDVAALDWSAELCSMAGIQPGALSPIEPSGHDLGAIAEAAAVEMGLPSSVRVLAGGHDQTCAALGLGAVEPGAVVLSAGTAWVLTVIMAQASTSVIPGSFNVSPHVVPSRWTASQYLGGLGAVIAWCLEEAVSADAEHVAAGRPEADDPFFVPRLHDENRTTWGEYVGGGEERDRPSQLGAVFESCAFEVRRAVDEMPSAAKDNSELLFVGGGTRSGHLTQTIADVIQRDVTVFGDASWPAIGAARLAMSGLGWPAPAAQVDAPTLVASRPDYAELYKRRYGIYLDLTSGESL